MSRIIEASMWAYLLQTDDPAVKCKACADDGEGDGMVSLSDADSVNEAVEIWNNHVQRVHNGGDVQFEERKPY